jgi:hypothetical protein
MCSNLTEIMLGYKCKVLGSQIDWRIDFLLQLEEEEFTERAFFAILIVAVETW